MIAGIFNVINLAKQQIPEIDKHCFDAVPPLGIADRVQKSVITDFRHYIVDSVMPVGERSGELNDQAAKTD